MSITCTVCGTVNPDGTQFCEGCGVELSAPHAASQSVSSHATPDQSATLAATPELGAGINAAPAAPLETPPLEEPMTPAAPSIPAPSTPTSEPLSTPLSTPLEAIPTPAPVAPAVPASDMPTTEAAAPAMPASDMAAPITETPVPETPIPETPVAAAPAPETPTTPTTPATPSAGGEARLGIKKYGAATGEFIPLNGEKLVVGRFDASSGPVDIDLSGLGGQEHISRRHAELYREGGVWHVRDLGSTNGVYIKRKGEASFSPRLQEPAALGDGDELAFGNLMLSFHQG